jgi:phosphohistidine phosphatase
MNAFPEIASVTARRACSRQMGVHDDIPLFDDDTGEALNASARQLVLDALEADLQKPPAENEAESPSSLGPALSSIPAVVCAEGTYKYVQVQLTHPNAPGAQLLVVRSYSSCQYHAENYQRLMRELRADPKTSGVVGRVVGGGRIRFDGVDEKNPSAAVWGYSKTFGRTQGCNERTASIVKREVSRFQNRVEWSDEGY